MVVFQLLLLKRGGRVIYAGPLGVQSRILVDYFEVNCLSHLFQFGVTKFKHSILLKSVSRSTGQVWQMQLYSLGSENKRYV